MNGEYEKMVQVSLSELFHIQRPDFPAFWEMFPELRFALERTDGGYEWTLQASNGRGLHVAVDAPYESHRFVVTEMVMHPDTGQLVYVKSDWRKPTFWSGNYPGVAREHMKTILTSLPPRSYERTLTTGGGQIRTDSTSGAVVLLEDTVFWYEDRKHSTAPTSLLEYADTVLVTT